MTRSPGYYDCHKPTTTSTARQFNAKESKKYQQFVIVGECNGGGIRVSAAMNDMKQALNGILPNVLKVRRKTTSKSPNAAAVFMDKFEGRMHPEKIILAGKTFGHFSYCYLGTQSCTQVWEYMREARIMRITPGDPFSDGNVRVPVHLANNGDLMPMNSFFSETEILELCISDDWYAKRWRQKYSPMSQAKDFFWYADDIDEKPDLRDMVEAAKAALQETAEF